MKKPAHILSYRAERDMEGIWDYTAVHWNVEQADRYVRQLNAAMEAAAQHPYNGRLYEYASDAYYRISAGSHIIFYRVTASGINIVRVLHQRMDFIRHI